MNKRLLADSTVKTKFNLEVHVASKYKAFQMKKTPYTIFFEKNLGKFEFEFRGMQC